MFSEEFLQEVCQKLQQRLRHELGELVKIDKYSQAHLLFKRTVAIPNIQAALKRVRAGTYGFCVECGDQIPIERLQAVPSAPRCRACQEQQEKTSSKP